VRVVLCNAPPADAERIARALVDARLAACVNIVPGVISIYRWRGNVERESESTLLIKTRDERISQLMEELKKLHPYEVPEMVVLPVADVNAAYRQWVDDETS
jgi:periplasmic divalent cation tolerance protein